MPTLHLTGNFLTTQKYGGVSRYLIELASGMAQQSDWSVRIGSPIYINEYLHANRKRLRHRGIFLNKYYRGLLSLNELLVDLGASGSLRSADIVHETNFNYVRLQRKGPGRVSTFYDMVSEAVDPQDAVREKKRQTAELSDKIVSISESTKSDMVHFLGVPPDKIEVIHLASRIEPTQHRDSIVPSERYVLWVGTRFAYKNFDTLVLALSRTENFSKDHKLVCAGGPPFSDSEKALLDQHGFSDAQVIHRSPDESQLASLYSHAELLVYPSRYEGFGLPPLEAMTCGCPVVASDRTSVPEITGNAAILIDPDQPDSLAEAINSVLTDSSLRSELIDRGRLRAGHFSWEKCVDSHLKLYDSIR